MLDWIDKHRITWADIERLVADQQVENDLVEFKQALHTKNGQPHPWYCGSDKVDEKARNALISELVALANTFGGWLFLGIAEKDGVPPRAWKICPVPRCEALAQKLHQMIDECVDPKIPDFRVVPVMPPTSDAGVLVIQAGRSPSAPHRLAPTRQVYVRRNDRCVEATMAEVHTLVLSTQRRTVEALWTATFAVPQGRKNGGVVVLDQGRVFGGDSQYYYEGRYEVEGDILTADFRAHHYHGEPITSFGDRATIFQVFARGRYGGTEIKGDLNRPGFPPGQVVLTRRQGLP